LAQPGTSVDGYYGGMTTTPETSPEYVEVPPSQAPRLVPWDENSSFLSPGGAVAGISAMAEAATSSGRSKAARLFTQIVVIVILISLIAGGVWRWAAF
jgi:hypothetical protein